MMIIWFLTINVRSMLYQVELSGIIYFINSVSPERFITDVRLTICYTICICIYMYIHIYMMAQRERVNAIVVDSIPE